MKRKNEFKKLLSVLLALLMIISAVPLSGISAFAVTDEDYEYEILEDGTAEITGHSGWGTGNLIIPSDIDGYTVTSIGDSAFYFSNITSVVIPDTVTQIKQMAFMYCTSLTNVTLSNSLTDIGFLAFLGCAFDSIELPSTLKTIASGAFEMCYNLETINIPAGVTEIQAAAFADCISLKKINVDPANENYCDVDGVLFGKDKTTLVAFPNFLSDSYVIPDTTEYISGNAFSNCSNLVSISIPGSVKEIGFQAFYGCGALKNIDMSDGIELIGESAFESCSALTNINIPGSIKEIGVSAFNSCSSLENVQLANGIEFLGENAFENCGSLSSIYIPASVMRIGDDCFYNCQTIQKITVDSENKNYSDVNGVLFSKDKSTLIYFPYLSSDTYEIPDTVKKISENAFSNCNKLVSVTIPNSVNEIGQYAFAYCTSLTSIDIPGSVKEIGSWAFYGCDELKNIELSDGIELIGESAFGDCGALTNIDIPGSVKEIGPMAFSNCLSLETLKIGNGVEKIGSDAFVDCSALREANIPASVTEIGERAFLRCTSLEKLEVDPDNKNYCDVDNVLFNKAQTELIQFHDFSTDTYEIPDTVTVISTCAFSECDNLVNVEVPNSIKEIKEEAFNGCTALESIALPNSVETIGVLAFGNCTAFTSVMIPDSVNRIDYCAFGYVDMEDGAGVESVTGFKIYGYAGTAAEIYANDNCCEFIALDKAVDESTGISVFEKDLNVIPDGAQLKAQQLSADDNKITFDISLIKDGDEVQPSGEVTVKIPVPEGMDGSLLKVYREETDGSLTDMNAYFADGYMVFTTDHFSKYILTVEESAAALKGDINGDGIVDAADAVLALRFDAGLISLTDEQVKTADVNSDGIADAADAVLILRYDAGLIDEL